MTSNSGEQVRKFMLGQFSIGGFDVYIKELANKVSLQRELVQYVDDRTTYLWTLREEIVKSLEVEQLKKEGDTYLLENARAGLYQFWMKKKNA